MSEVTNENFGIPNGDGASNAPAEPSAAEQIAALQAQLAAANARLAAVNEVVPEEPPGDLDSQGFPRKYVKLRVFKGQKATDPQYVNPGINGFHIRIKRGEDVIIPEVFAQVLDHAIEDLTTKSEGGLEFQQSHRYPFAVLGPASEEEYLSFRSKMREMGAKAALQA